MNDIERTPEYFSWIGDLKKRYRATQIKAAVAVNSALLEFYWHLGKDISERYAREAFYGSAFFAKLSADLAIAIPEATGLSARNIRYCVDFFELYSTRKNLQQPVAKSGKAQAAPSKQVASGRRQEADEGDTLAGIQHLLVQVPWGHHIVIMGNWRRAAGLPEPQ